MSIYDVEDKGVDNGPWTRSLFEGLAAWLAHHGYRDPVGVIIIPLMEDGFGVLAAGGRGQHISQDQAFEYIMTIGEQLHELNER